MSGVSCANERLMLSDLTQTATTLVEGLKMQTPFVNPPLDVLIRIFTLCDAKSIITLRQCCTTCDFISRDRYVWDRSMAYHISETCYSYPLHSLDRPGLESLASSSFRFQQRTENSTRFSKPHVLFPTSHQTADLSGTSWSSLCVALLGKWVFSLSNEATGGVVKMWDLSCLPEQGTLEPLRQFPLNLAPSNSVTSFSTWKHNPDGRIALCIQETIEQGVMHHLRFFNLNNDEVHQHSYFGETRSTFWTGLDFESKHAVRRANEHPFIRFLDLKNRSSITWTNLTVLNFERVSHDLL
ncbi:hypothetical protein DL96DRAFT_542235 [Flagelloscypha sp. PMI_526]|nr:hypothetical protein DL96DRAFT_542235 [Flagelloscypha sp. PMI_526]